MARRIFSGIQILLRVDLLDPRHRHAQRDRLLSFLHMAIELEPALERVERPGLDAAEQTLKHRQQLIAEAVVPELRIRLADHARF